MKARIIAFYLPQFHPTANNDKWWGKGFTEWTNVGKAKPLFFGHKQPKVPADLGYYDLRIHEIRIAQAELARKAGIEGFCYYHYWFGDGIEELDMPFKEVIRLKEPNFPFCLCWANETWHKKFWNLDGTFEKQLLVEQKYDNVEGHTKHFYSLLHAFKDNRYIKHEGKPVFMIYKPFDFENLTDFMNLWNSLAKENNLNGIYFIAKSSSRKDIDSLLKLGFNAVSYDGMWEWKYKYRFVRYINRMFSKMILRQPFIHNYSDMVNSLSNKSLREYTDEYVYPTIIPNWDHSPRSGKGAYILKGSTPKEFYRFSKNVINNIQSKKESSRIIFLKAWNEWGEGNYMEPDLEYGHGYIDALSKAND